MFIIAAHPECFSAVINERVYGRTSRVSGGALSHPNQLGGIGDERRKLPHGGVGRSHSRKTILRTLYAILCDFRPFFVTFGSYQSLRDRPNIRNMWG